MRLRTSFNTIAPLLVLASAVVGLSACSDNNPAGNDDDNQAPPLTAPYYIQATINGKNVTYQENKALLNQTGQATFMNTVTDGPTVFVSQEYTFNKAELTSSGPEVDTLAGWPRITFIKNYVDSPLEDELDQLVTSSMEYGSEIARTDGVQITWTDANGKTWCSSWGPGNQAGSSFKVTEHTKIDYQIGQVTGGRYNSKGTFNCTLYDNSGNSIALTNGKFSLQTVFE